jgi:multiple sugar transport system permease protein
MAFVGPWLVGFLALVAWPFAASLAWSFTRYDVLTPPRYVGLENYRRLAEEIVAGDRAGLAVWNTLYYAAVSVPLTIGLGIALAVMLSWQVRGQAVYRTLFYLPSVVPVVATAVLWRWLLDPRDGLVNYLLGLVGLPGPGWLTSHREAAWPLAWFTGEAGLGAKDGLALMAAWGVGNVMVIFLAAIGDVPAELYDAASIDGAGPWRRFRHVTLPMLTPVIFFNLVMGLIHAVQTFTAPYVVSDGSGGPAGSTLVLSLHVFLAAFKELELGYASAVAWVLLVVTVIVTVALFRTARHWVHYR